jgi:hypothetical protein
MTSASSNEMHYSVVRAIIDAASEAKAGGSSVSVVLLRLRKSQSMQRRAT